MLRFIRSAITGLIIFLISLLVTFFTTGYALHQFGEESLHHIRGVLKSRSEGLALSLREIGAMGNDPAAMVVLSRAMYRVQEHSNRNPEGFPVREMFYLDENNRILAHSDIALVASESGKVYSEERFGSIIHRPQRDPAIFSSMDKRKAPDDPVELAIFSYLETFYQDLVARQFLASVAVHPVDQPIAEGGLHIVMENNLIHSLIAGYRSKLIETLMIGFALSAGPGIFVFLILLIFFPVRGKSKRAVDRPFPAAVSAMPVSSALQEEFENEGEAGVLEMEEGDQKMDLDRPSDILENEEFDPFDPMDEIEILPPLSAGQKDTKLPEGIEAFDDLYAEDRFSGSTNESSWKDGLQEGTDPENRPQQNSAGGLFAVDEFQARNEEFTGPTKILDAIPLSDRKILKTAKRNR